MSKFLIACFSLLTLSPAWAQLTESDTLQFGYKATINGSWITGNVQRLLINNGIDLSHVGKHVGIKTSNTYIYGTIFQNKTENDFFSRNFFYYEPRARLYPFMMVWLQNSRRQQIGFRHQAGFGVTYAALQKSNHLMKVSVTVTHEQTRYNDNLFDITPKNLTGNKVQNWRGTVRAMGHYVLSNNKILLHYETWYQPAFDDTNNWRYYFNASLELPIAKYVSFRGTINYWHENLVLTRIKRDDKIVTFGLVFGNF